MEHNVSKNKILEMKNILTKKEIRMLQNVGYVLLSENIVKKAENSENYKIKKIDNILLLQLNS
ncbi:hypothetical protein ACMC56_12250 [Campylobacterota bacterium DY0563]|uniref:hypothetical protein n=1 Tax=Halarcobacter sp. TaxID=2321133 RepID=UPI0029F466DB|nr:hypothetical protein [Halarcobacter sp.]